jgi:hypothetical protein
MRPIQKKIIIPLIFVYTSVPAMFFSFDRAAAQAGCTVASLQGSFGYSFSGNFQGTSVAGVGLVTYDGSGHLTGADTVSIRGVITPVRPIKGTYSVNSYCAGTMRWVTSEGTADLNFVMSAGGTQLYFIQTTPGSSVVGAATKR